jgi:Pentapeptide repeats (8 copies)
MNDDHLAVLKKDVATWNAWRHRRRNDVFRPDLAGADLRDADLRDVDLHDATLTKANPGRREPDGADLTNAILNDANLTNAILNDANLSNADLRDANLENAILNDANLIRANLIGAILNGSNLTNANLNGAILSQTDFDSAACRNTVFAAVDLSVAIGLESIDHLGPSTVGTDTLSRSCGRIPSKFLRGCGFNDWEIGVFSRICGSFRAPVADPTYGTGRFPSIGTSESRRPFWW